MATRPAARLALLLALVAAPASAATIPVDNLTDTPAPGTCSLREAIAAANADSAQGGCLAGAGADTIVFTGSGTIVLGASLPQIASTITIDGRGQTVAIAGGHPRALFVRPDGTLRLESLTLQDNGVPLEIDDAGGAIQNEGVLEVTNCTFARNFAQGGGAIVNGGALTVTRSAFWANRADSGGAISQDDAATAGVSNTTFSGNVARFGGAIAFVGTADGPGSLAIVNSTFSGNSAETGGGVLASGALTLANTIIANSTGGDCLSLGLTNAAGPNLIQDGSCGAALGGDPLLAPLANAGGPTATHALLDGSPAIGAGNTTICQAAPVSGLDQRGEPRGAAACDLGAYETLKAFFDFSGFFAPVDNLPVLNTTVAGRAVPIKFTLGGNMGLGVLSSVVSKPMACDVSGGTAPVEELAVAAGGSGLTYDAASSQYTFVWKTEKAWKTSCRQFVLTLSDGTEHRAYFQFK